MRFSIFQVSFFDPLPQYWGLAIPIKTIYYYQIPCVTFSLLKIWHCEKESTKNFNMFRKQVRNKQQCITTSGTRQTGNTRSRQRLDCSSCNVCYKVNHLIDIHRPLCPPCKCSCISRMVWISKRPLPMITNRGTGNDCSLCIFKPVLKLKILKVMKYSIFTTTTVVLRGVFPNIFWVFQFPKYMFQIYFYFFNRLQRLAFYTQYFSLVHLNTMSYEWIKIQWKNEKYVALQIC